MKFEKIIKYLASKKYPKNMDKVWDLVFANIDVELSELLLEHEIPVKVGDFELESFISGGGSDEIVINAIKAGLDPNISFPSKRQNSLLHKYVASNNEKMVKFLIKMGADVNAKCSDNLSPLHSAVSGIKSEFKYVTSKNWRVGVIDLLIDAGADAKQKQGNDNASLFEWAIMSIDIWKKLYDSGCPLDYEKKQQFSGDSCKVNAFYRPLTPSVFNVNFIDENKLIKWVELAIGMGVGNETEIKDGENMFFYFLRTSNMIDTKEKYKKIIDTFIENGFCTEDENKDNVFHQAFKWPPCDSLVYKVEALMENKFTKKLLNKPNNQGVRPYDILKVYGQGEINGGESVKVKNMYNGLLMRKRQAMNYKSLLALVEKNILEMDIDNPNGRKTKKLKIM